MQTWKYCRQRFRHELCFICIEQDHGSVGWGPRKVGIIRRFHERSVMKTMRSLCLLCLCLLLGTTASAALIGGVTIESVSSEYLSYGWDLGAAHLVDGSGLAGGLHAQTKYPGGQSWQTISQTGTGNVVFDLGAIFQLASVHVWNLNFTGPYNGRGAKDVDILISTDLLSWQNLGEYLFVMATGLDGDPGFEVAASDWDATRYVQFDIKNNFGLYDNAGHVGLSEVQFSTRTVQTLVPEPATALLLGAGLAGLAFACRRPRRR